MGNVLILHIAIYDSEEKKCHTGYEATGPRRLAEADHRG